MGEHPEQSHSLNHSKVVLMPEREILARKFQGLGMLGVSEQTNRFWNSLAENLDGVKLNDAGLVLVWETTLQKSLGEYGQMMVGLVGMSFDRVVDAITTDQEFANSAKKVREDLNKKLKDLSKAAEPKLEDLGPEDSLENLERFQQARRIADIIFEYVGTDYRHAKNGVSMGDGRDESANPYYNQTHRGFFLEAHYGLPSSLWTPWGEYHFGNAAQ